MGRTPYRRYGSKIKCLPYLVVVHPVLTGPVRSKSRGTRYLEPKSLGLSFFTRDTRRWFSCIHVSYHGTD